MAPEPPGRHGAAAWTCVVCDEENPAGAVACGHCRRAPAYARGDAMVAAVVSSLPTATIGLTPPPVAQRKPERAPHPDDQPRESGAKGVVLLTSVAVIALAVGLGWGRITRWLDGDDQPDRATASAPAPVAPSATGTATASPTPAVTPCPDVVTRWFPEDTTAAALVALYDTGGYVVTLCRAASGQLYYDGQQKGVEASSTSHIFLRAQETSTGYTAVNVDYLYRIDGRDLILTHNGEVVRHWILTPVG